MRSLVLVLVSTVLLSSAALATDASVPLGGPQTPQSNAPQAGSATTDSTKTPTMPRAKSFGHQSVRRTDLYKGMLCSVYRCWYAGDDLR